MRAEIVVSDFSGERVEEGDLATITLRFADGRRGEYVADASTSDEVVRQIISGGRRRKIRGRRPRTAQLDEALVGQARQSAGVAS